MLNPWVELVFFLNRFPALMKAAQTEWRVVINVSMYLPTIDLLLPYLPNASTYFRNATRSNVPSCGKNRFFGIKITIS